MIGLKRACCGLLSALVCMAVAGCGGDGLVTVTGKVVRDGKPITIANYEEGEECLSVAFMPLDEGGKPKAGASAYSQDVQEDGSFEIRGDMGDGIPVGKYRVAISRLRGGEGVGGDEEGKKGGADAWESKFGGENSPFIFDVTGDDILIDLAKPGE